MAHNPPIRKGKILFWKAIYVVETRPRVDYRQHNLILYLFVWKKKIHTQGGKSSQEELIHTRKKNERMWWLIWRNLYLVTCKAHHFISNTVANIVSRWIGTVSSEYVINRLKTKICHHKQQIFKSHSNRNDSKQRSRFIYKKIYFLFASRILCLKKTYIYRSMLYLFERRTLANTYLMFWISFFLVCFNILRLHSYCFDQLYDCVFKFAFNVLFHTKVWNIP